ncbi:MAG: VTT domain-containing protein [Coriobacteriales bacterium]|jgi:membrane-associated protein
MDVLISLLQDPRAFIADWIITLGPIWVYIPLFAIIFIETGLVVMPFLPGDSLLFTAGIFAADGGGLNIWALLILMYIAAILGNTSNYWIGRGLGGVIMKSGKVKALNEENLVKTQKFFDKYGMFAIVVTRFFPIIRTIAPFCAGFGRMSFPKFTAYNVIGGVSWVTLFVLLGYFFGGIPFVQKNFELVIVGIIVISFIPAIAGAIKAKFGKKKGDSEDASGEAAEEVANSEKPVLAVEGAEVDAVPEITGGGEYVGEHIKHSLHKNDNS